MRVAIAVILVLGLSAVLIFVMINSGETVPINLFYLNLDENAVAPEMRTPEYPISLIVLGALISGVLFASVLGIIEGTRLRLQNHKLRGRVKKLEAEVHALRKQPAPGVAAPEALDEDSVL